MTKEELLSGVKFSYGIGNYYQMECTQGGEWIICQFSRYVASVMKIGSKYIQATTYVMDKRVDVKIDISKCKIMEEPAGVVIL